jgi:hypothetical protein
MRAVALIGCTSATALVVAATTATGRAVFCGTALAMEKIE